MPPDALFLKEKDLLVPAGNLARLHAFAGDVVVQEVPPTMLVKVRGRYWSVPRRRVGKTARRVSMPGGTLAVYVSGELVAAHDTAAGAGRVNYEPGHYAEALEGKRWAAAAFDGDIERAAAENLRLLGQLGGGGGDGCGA